MFIGPKEVKVNIELIDKTPKGTNLLEVEYVDGTKEVISKSMYDLLISETSYDLTTLRERRVYPVAKEVLSVLLEYGIKISELQFFSAILSNSIDHNRKEAIAKLFGKPEDDVTTIDIDKLLRKVTLNDVLQK